MKIKRQKTVNRILSFFKHNFGHHPPYQLLLDGTFCQACLSMKVNIKEQLPKYLGDVKLLTTKCCIQEVEKLGPELFGATVILKQFAVHKCGHDDEPKPASKCIKSMLGAKNENRYFVASQDPEVRVKARKVPGTPVMYLHHSAPVLEKPSDMSSAAADDAVKERVAGPDFQSKMLDALKKKEFRRRQTETKEKKEGRSESSFVSQEEVQTQRRSQETQGQAGICREKAEKESK